MLLWVCCRWDVGHPICKACTGIGSMTPIASNTLTCPPSHSDSKLENESLSSDAAKSTADGGESTPTSTAGGGSAALFPCLVYYPGSNNYSLIWVPMDGSNPAISQAAGNLLWPGSLVVLPTVLRLQSNSG